MDYSAYSGKLKLYQMLASLDKMDQSKLEISGKITQPRGRFCYEKVQRYLLTNDPDCVKTIRIFQKW